MPDALNAVGKQFAEPGFLEAINAIPADERETFAADPAAWLGNAGYPVPDGVTVSVDLIQTTDQREDFGLGKFKICVGPSWAQICYAHGPGEHT